MYEIECYFPTWAIPKDHKVTKALESAYTSLYGHKRIGAPETLEMRQARPLTDKWTFSTNGVSIMGRNGIPCIGFGPGAEAQAHAPNEKTWKQDLVTCAAVYAALPGEYQEDAMKTLQDYIDKLNKLNFKEMYNGDFFLTWEKTDEELEAVFTVADALRFMRENNISTKVFKSGLGISLFRIWMRANLRWLTVRRFGKQPT